MKPLRIIIDTREQTPWSFPEEIAVVRRGTLNAGDYALDGDNRFVIERKSLNDFLGTISSGWDRFERELDRMADHLHIARVIVVEGSIRDIIEEKHNHPNLKLGFILKRIGRLTIDGVSVLMAENSVVAAIVAYKILKERNSDLEASNERSSKENQNQDDGGAEHAGQGMGVPEAGQQVDNPECPVGIRAKMHRQRDSGIRAETWGSTGAGRKVEEKPICEEFWD